MKQRGYRIGEQLTSLDHVRACLTLAVRKGRLEKNKGRHVSYDMCAYLLAAIILVDGRRSIKEQRCSNMW